MVGSAQGWVEAPYVDAPANADALVAGIVAREGGARRDAAYRAGRAATRRTAQRDARRRNADFRRAQPGRRTPPTSGKRALIGLPGTHAKWAVVQAGRIERFHTFMTGEVFARTARAHDPRPHDGHAGSSGYRSIPARREHRPDKGQAGLLATVFSTRTLGLTGQLARDTAARLSVGLADRTRTGRPRSRADATADLARRTELAPDRQRSAVRALSPRARAIRLHPGGAGEAGHRARPVAHRLAGGAGQSRPPRRRARADRRARHSRNKEPTCSLTSICPHRTCRTRV